MSHRHNFVTISGRKFTENAEKPGRRAPERVPLPGFLSIKWHVVFKMKAHRRPVSGCGSQRMLHALERRSHPADHGPSFASLYSPFCRYATSSPDRGKSLLAGGGQLSCNSRTGQIKNPPSECSGSNHIRHSYRMGLATTTTAASGRCREELLGQRPARRKCRPRHARMLGAATRGTKKEPTGLFFAACGRPCSFDSSYGLHETATALDVPSRWDPRTKQQPTGLIAYPAAQGRAVRFPYGSN